jgi:hypothetical protein
MCLILVNMQAITALWQPHAAPKAGDFNLSFGRRKIGNCCNFTNLPLQKRERPLDCILRLNKPRTSPSDTWQSCQMLRSRRSSQGFQLALTGQRTRDLIPCYSYSACATTRLRLCCSVQVTGEVVKYRWQVKLLSTGDRWSCSVQVTGGVAQYRWQVELFSTGDRWSCSVQVTGEVVQYRWHTWVTAVKLFVHSWFFGYKHFSTWLVPNWVTLSVRSVHFDTKVVRC